MLCAFNKSSERLYQQHEEDLRNSLDALMKHCRSVESAVSLINKKYPELDLQFLDVNMGKGPISMGVISINNKQQQVFFNYQLDNKTNVSNIVRTLENVINRSFING